MAKFKNTPSELAIMEGKELDEDSQETSSTEEVVEEVVEDEVVQDPPVTESEEDFEEEEVAEEVTDEEVTPESQSKEPSEPEDWIDSTVLDRAAAYGLTEADLTRIPSRDDFEKTTSLLDSKLVRQHEIRQALQEREAQQAQETPPPEETKPTKPVSLEKIDPALYPPEEYDDKTIGLVKTVRQLQDELESRNADRETYLQQVAEFQERLEFTQEHLNNMEVLRQNQLFDAAMNQQPEELYGRTVDEKGNYVNLSPEFQQRRQENLDTIVNILLPHYQLQSTRSGQPVDMPSYEALVDRASRIVHLEERSKSDMSSKQNKLKKQSAKRRRVAGPAVTRSARTVPLEENPRYSVEREVEIMMNHPQVIEAWEKVNGAV